MGEVKALVCGLCGSSRRPHHFGTCQCGGPLLMRYRMEGISPGDLPRRHDLWRYLPVLPVEAQHIVTLGEGWTPLRPMRSFQERGMRVFLKDEAVSPTGTFKARGMAVAVSGALAAGLRRLAVPSAGSAGVALAAYAGAAGLEALVVLPLDTPYHLIREVRERGAHCFLVEGSIEAAGRLVEEARDLGYTNLATLREPFRVEGKKTMGFEIWEQLGQVPDWLVFPTGGGTGVVGLWKAFRELEALGWSEGRPPRICAVQSSGCPPIARAWAGEDPGIREPRTVAVGLRVPRPSGLHMILKVLRQTQGLALEVPEEKIPEAARRMGAREGVYPCYEGAAAYLAVERLRQEGLISSQDRVVMFNTGTGLINEVAARPEVPILHSGEDLVRALGG